MGPSFAPLALSALITIVWALCLVGWFTHAVDDPDRRTHWAGAHGVAVTPTNRALVAWWVQLSGTLRVIGAVSGMVLGTLFDRAFAVSTSTGIGFWVWIVLGWVAGGTWAWEVVTRSSDRPAGAASLVPRRPADYVPGPIRWAPVAAAALTVAIAASGRWLGPIEDPQGFPVAGPVARWLLAIGAVVLAVAATAMVSRVVARGQAAADPDVLAADDAIRATTIHLISGGATAAILLLGVQAAEFALQPRQLPFGVRGWAPLALVLGAWFSSRYLANRPWRVRRPGLDQVPAR